MLNILIIMARIVRTLRLWPLVQSFVLSEFFINLTAIYLSKNLSLLFGKQSKSKSNVLVFNSERWLADLNVLNNTNELNLFDFKNSYISFI